MDELEQQMRARLRAEPVDLDMAEKLADFLIEKRVPVRGKMPTMKEMFSFED